MISSDTTRHARRTLRTPENPKPRAKGAKLDLPERTFALIARAFRRFRINAVVSQNFKRGRGTENAHACTRRGEALGRCLAEPPDPLLKQVKTVANKIGEMVHTYHFTA